MFSGGTGTKEDPYLIGSVEDLNEMRNYDSTGTASFYKQICDIDFEWADWNNPWIFYSAYDGSNYKIMNVNVANPTYASFFGAIYETLEDHTLKNIRIINMKSLHPEESYSGGLSGMVQGKVKIKNCHLENVEIEGGYTAGGFVGYTGNDVVIEQCSVTGKGTFEDGAGFCGANKGIIRHCRTNMECIGTNHTIGGFVYSGDGLIEKCYAAGTIRLTTTSVATGGVSAFVSNVSGTIRQCTTDVKIIGTARACSGFAGRLGKGCILEDCYAKGDIDVEMSSYLNAIQVGGIVQDIFRKDAVVRRCYFMGNIKVTTPEVYNENAGELVRIGGIAGDIYNSHNNQGITTIENCFSITPSITLINRTTGTEIEDFTHIGRIWGYYTDTTMNAHNYALDVATYNSSTTFPEQDKTLTGKDGQDMTLEELKTKATYEAEGWDFENVWDINPYYNNGFPYLKWENPTIKKIGTPDYIRLQKTNPKRTIKKLVSSFNFDGDKIEYEAGSGEEHETLKIENPFMNQAILNTVFSELNGFEYVPYNMTWRCYPQMDVGDFCILETRKGDILETFLMSNRISFKSGLRAEVKAPAPSWQKSEFPYKGTLKEYIERVDKTAIKENKDYYGVRTSRDFGLKIKREDGKSEVILNSDKMEFLVNGERKIYFDVQEELYKFTGKIIASMFVGGTIDIGEGTFSVDSEGKVTINSGSIIITREDGKARIVISEAAGITFQKWNEVLEDWEETIGLDSEGAGVITGGTLRTAKDGRRVEVSNNQIRSYNDSGELHGLVTNNTSDNFGDWEFYNKGELIFTIYNAEDAISLIPSDEVPFVVGSGRAPLNVRGSYIRINGNLIPTLPSKTAAATYGENEQQMLQEVYDKMKQLLDAINNN